jgi:hypothetical protein
MQLKPLLWALVAATTLANTALSQKTNRGPGDVIWQETFDAVTWSNTVVDDATVIENLPAGWNFQDNTGNGFHWQWSQQGPRGRHTSPNGGSVPKNQLLPATPISSTTAANGFLLMPSDWYNTADDGSSVPTPVSMNAFVEFGPIDLSAVPEIHFRMEYFFKLLKPVNAQISFGFRDNTGNNVGYILDYEENIPSANPAIIDWNITEMLTVNGLNKEQIYIRILYNGPTHYFLMIDDIRFYQPLNRDLQIKNNWLDYHIIGGQNQNIDNTIDYFGGYKNIPLMIVDTFPQFRTRVQNFGGIVREDVYSHLVIDNLTIPQINPVYEHVSDSQSINPPGYGNFVNSVPFKPNQYGVYRFTTTVTDGLPEDTQFNTVQKTMNITQTLYSYVDTLATTGFLAMQADTTTSNEGNGQLFWIPDIGTNSVQFQNIGFYIHPSQNVNHLNAQEIEVTGRLFRKNGVVYELIQSTAPYKPVATDRGKFVALPFLNPQELQGNRDYYLVLKTTGQTTARRLMLANDPNHQQSYGRSGIILGASNNLIIVDKTPAFYTHVTGGFIPEETDIIAYNLSGQIGNTQINAVERTVGLIMPYGTDVTTLVPEFVLSVNASANIGVVPQTSGVTPVDFTTPVTYTVTNGTNSTDWAVTVTVLPEPQADILSFSITGQVDQTVIDMQNNTITMTMPFGQNLTALVPSFTLSDGASVTVDSEVQISGVSAHDFTNPVNYVVVAYDNVTTKTWTVTVLVGAEPIVPFFVSFSLPEEVEQTFNSQSRTIFIKTRATNLTALIPTFALNVTSAKAFIGSVEQVSAVTPANFSSPVVYTLEDGSLTSTWTVTVSNVLHSGNNITEFSIPGQRAAEIDAVNNSILVVMPNDTALSNLIPVFQVSQGARVYIGGVEQISGTTPVNFTNTVTYAVISESGQNRNWQVRVVHIGSLQSGTEILAFGFSGQTQQAVVDTSLRRISVNLSPNLNINSLIPVFVLSPGAKAYKGNTQITSGGNILNFTNNTVFRVRAENLFDMKDWTITVTNNQSSQAAFESFKLEFDYNQDTIVDTTFHATIYNSNSKIEIHLPQGTRLDSLRPIWTVSPGATVKVDTVMQTSGQSYVDLSRTVLFTVIAQDNTVTRTWTLYTYADLVGIQNHELYNLVRIFPNPATTSLHVSVPEDMRNGRYQIFNIFGQTLQTDKYKGVSFDIDIESLPRGVYFIKINSDRYQVIEKLLFK